MTQATTYKQLDKVGSWAYTILNDDGTYVSLKDITSDDKPDKEATLALYDASDIMTKIDGKGKNEGGLRYFVEVNKVVRKPSQASVRNALVVDKLMQSRLDAMVVQLVGNGIDEKQARAIVYGDK